MIKATTALVGLASAMLVMASAQAANGRKAELERAYLLNGVETVPGPANGGSCAAPTAFTSVPYADTGTTVGATNIIASIPAGCSDYTATAGPQVVYSFVAGPAANLTFNVVPTTATYDPSIYLVSTCATGTTCIAGADAGYDGDAETFTVSSLTAGTTYYLHIDSFYSTAAGSGAYSLSVTGTLPVQLQEFQIN